MPRSHRGDDVARTRKKNESLMAAVTSVQLGAAPVADVASLAVLVEIARKYETMILELPRDGGHDYLLWDDGLVFRYRHTDTDSAAQD